jgi:hypothetical protein
MKKISILLFALVSLIILYSCYYDNMEYLYPDLNSTCDTSQVTFNGTISVMLQNNCLSCHSNSSAATFGGGIRLQNYSDVSASGDRVRGAINHESGYSAMPKNGGTLDACSIQQFDIWLAAGKPEN